MEIKPTKKFPLRIKDEKLYAKLEKAARAKYISVNTLINTILEDSLIGFFLEPFQHSFRKRLLAKPKFYYFDTGVVRTLSRQLSVKLVPSTSAFGECCEHFIILECMKLASYFNCFHTKTSFKEAFIASITTLISLSVISGYKGMVIILE